MKKYNNLFYFRHENRYRKKCNDIKFQNNELFEKLWINSGVF